MREATGSAAAAAAEQHVHQQEHAPGAQSPCLPRSGMACFGEHVAVRACGREVGMSTYCEWIGPTITPPLRPALAARTWEQRLAAQQLRQDAPHRPQVDRRPVVAARQQQLGRTVPPRHHILGHQLAAVHVSARLRSAWGEGVGGEF